eukprot:gnl/Spiro4/7879_TR4148_c0_g1_i1.p1 gnl/Spiro4/7879_TR4148_c0_g1~~gnl/Spiro4/7879_TR4148_c0_g1_i1.p1  ORF type:complete len:350 (+),score=12.23 gnl/Spiro4/7879_TR4148_c0_g1_i1:125-1174(+)
MGGRCSLVQPGPTPSVLDQLSDEVLCVIFRCVTCAADLCALSAVCRRWHNVITTKNIWDNLDFSLDQKNLDDKRVFCLPDVVLKSLVNVNFNHCSKITDSSIEFLIHRCPRIAKFDLFRCPLITQNTLQSLGTFCPRLDFLNVAFNPQVTDTGLQFIAQGCPNLRHLKIPYCYSFSDVGMIAIAECCPKLVTLDITHAQVTNLSLFTLSENCLLLENLGLCYCNAISSVGVVRLAQKLKHLHTLDLRFCESVGLLSIKVLVRFVPTLRNLQYMQTPTDEIYEDDFVAQFENDTFNWTEHLRDGHQYVQYGMAERWPPNEARFSSYEGSVSFQSASMSSFYGSEGGSAAD